MRSLVTLFVLAACAAPAAAQTDTATLNTSLTGLARLTLSSSAITFPDADPDAVPLVPSSPPTISITAKARAAEGGVVTLTVQASDELRSGVVTLPASLITWTASGTGFAGGTLSATTPRAVATWSGSGVRIGTQSFFFANLWSHPTGTYTLTLLLTLSAA